MNTISYQSSLFQSKRKTNHKEYREFILRLESIDKIFTQSGIEFELAESYLEQMLEAKKKSKSNNARLTAKEIQRHTRYSIQALRCNYLRHELGTSFRETSFLIASSEDLQRFTLSGDFSYAQCPGKSKLQEFSKVSSSEYIKKLNDTLYSEFTDVQNTGKYDLSNPLDTRTILMDSFCLEANIHFPVDWVLLRDAARTLIKSIKCIRSHGLRHRIPAPEEFARKMNSLCIEMANSRRNKNAKKRRKNVFRRMKALVGVIKEHALRYRDILNAKWEESDLSKAEADQIIKRLDNVLYKLPKALKQANDRIISDRLTDSQEKILSLYDDSASVIIRGKDGAEVEFGNELLIIEQLDGFIVDFQLYENKIADTNKLRGRLGKINAEVQAIGADRGFHCKAISNELGKFNIFNGICPRSPSELIEKRRDPQFCKLQTRRSQTEGRIAAVKRFIGKLSPYSGFEDKQSNIAWGMFSHNLNLLARKMIAEQKRKIALAA